MLVVKLSPPAIMAEHRRIATLAAERPISRMAAFIIILVWVVSIGLVGWLVYRKFL
jgi:hypothetical protein